MDDATDGEGTSSVLPPLFLIKTLSLLTVKLVEKDDFLKNTVPQLTVIDAVVRELKRSDAIPEALQRTWDVALLGLQMVRLLRAIEQAPEDLAGNLALVNESLPRTDASEKRLRAKRRRADEDAYSEDSDSGRGSGSDEHTSSTRATSPKAVGLTEEKISQVQNKAKEMWRSISQQQPIEEENSALQEKWQLPDIKAGLRKRLVRLTLKAKVLKTKKSDENQANDLDKEINSYLSDRQVREIVQFSRNVGQYLLKTFRKLDETNPGELPEVLLEKSMTGQRADEYRTLTEELIARQSTEGVEDMSEDYSDGELDELVPTAASKAATIDPAVPDPQPEPERQAHVNEAASLPSPPTSPKPRAQTPKHARILSAERTRASPESEAPYQIGSDPGPGHSDLPPSSLMPSSPQPPLDSGPRSDRERPVYILVDQTRLTSVATPASATGSNGRLSINSLPLTASSPEFVRKTRSLAGRNLEVREMTVFKPTEIVLASPTRDSPRPSTVEEIQAWFLDQEAML